MTFILILHNAYFSKKWMHCLKFHVNAPDYHGKYLQRQTEIV